MATSIIAGRYRRTRLLEAPDGRVRPTGALVRKSLFQRLEPWTGKTVCDLYAGIGTLGIEALSRAAGTTTFVERDLRVISILERNLALTGCGNKATVVATDVRHFLAHTAQRFDVVLADPPYDSISHEDLLARVKPILKSSGVFVMELMRSAPVSPDSDVRRYGQTQVAIWRMPLREALISP